MVQYPNARLTPRGRETPVSRIESGVPVAEAAGQMGVSRQTASKWLRRSRSGEPMSDRSSRPRRLARSTPREVEDRVCEALVDAARPARAGGRHGRAGADVRQDRARRGIPRLADVDRVITVRYERERPGELVHVDVKKVARIPDGGGHRALGRGCGSARGAGASCLHVAVDDFSRVAYAELLPDERKGTCAAFMGRCLRFFEGMGMRVERVMTDNGPGYRSGEFNELLEAPGARHIYTRPFSPWQDGKVERMNRTIAQEWQYARAYSTEAERAAALPAFIVHYNWSRPHSACGGLSPMSRIVGVNNLLAHNS